MSAEIKNLKVEALKPKHLPMLALSEQTKRLGWIQIMLIRTWLSDAENKLQGLIPTRQPRCLVALENSQLIALIVLQPNNRKGCSWSISLPEFIKQPKNFSYEEIRSILLERALQIDINVAKSWLVRCQTTDKKQLEIYRKLGFQPLKIFKKWNLTSFSKSHISSIDSNIDINLEWETLSKNNAPLLSQLKKISESALLREMLNIQWIDLLDRNDPENGLLISTENNQRNAILGLATPICSEDLLSLELIRDIAWDIRIEKVIPLIITKLISNQPGISIESSTHDDKINKILYEMGLKEDYEEILLGRTIWKRKTNKKPILNDTKLNQMIERFKPKQSPLPSPMIDKDSP